MADSGADLFQLAGTERQNRIVQEALDRCDFPWKRLTAGLVATTGGRDFIPVEWADLSRFYGGGAAEPHLHHVHVGDDIGHLVVDARQRALGLAWYSGKVSIDSSLETEPQLAGEVFLSEAAHMTDFFYLSDEQRQAIWNAFHEDDSPHGHDWFDNLSYWDDVGEAYMGGFVRAFSDYPVTLNSFTHPTTDRVAAEIRNIVLGVSLFGLSRSSVFHDSHVGVKPELTWPTREAAIAAGRRPCGVCNP